MAQSCRYSAPTAPGSIATLGSARSRRTTTNATDPRSSDSRARRRPVRRSAPSYGGSKRGASLQRAGSYRHMTESTEYVTCHPHPPCLHVCVCVCCEGIFYCARGAASAAFSVAHASPHVVAVLRQTICLCHCSKHTIAGGTVGTRDTRSIASIWGAHTCVRQRER